VNSVAGEMTRGAMRVQEKMDGEKTTTTVLCLFEMMRRQIVGACRHMGRSNLG
jgi:hypothetical protein